MEMNLDEIWLIHLREIVDREATLAGGSLRAGYRSVAAKMAKSEEYIYQLYNGKPKADGKPRAVTLEFAKAMARHYAEGRPLDWVNEPPSKSIVARQPGPSELHISKVEPISTWPFKKITYRQFTALPRDAQLEIEDFLETLVTTWERKIIKTAKSSKR